MTTKKEALHLDAVETYRRGVERDKHNRDAFEEDIRFALLEEQWTDTDKAARAGRPCMVTNILGPVIRQVVNDSRQNKPAIKVMPQDSQADPETADIMSGLIRNIEASSDADVAYDTAVEHAVAGGFGYFRFNLKYACDDNWDQDIVIERVANPLSVVGDPEATSADGSDWNVAFITDLMSRKAFEREFPDAEPLDWDTLTESLPVGWCEEKQVRVAEFWTREQVKRQIVLLTDGSVVDLKKFEANAQQYAAAGVTVEGMPRDVLGYKVQQHLMNGKEILRTVDWAGKFIPIIPVYGHEVNLLGKRYFRSLIRSAKDAQRMFNYENSVAIEVDALAPKVPYIGPKGAFDHDQEKWETINSQSHPYVEYDPRAGDPPQRQQVGGLASASMQLANVMHGLVQQTTGIYNASLGAPSNETSGKAILARQREGDVSTFHFIDNLSRSIRHGGRILIDLIPKVYGPERVVRILGEDATPRNVTLNAPEAVMGPDGQPQTDETGAPITRIYDLTVGKYDLTVSSGPSYTTRREEAAAQMIEFVRAWPQAAPFVGDLLAKNLDWPGADEIAARLKAQIEGGDPQMRAQAEAMQQQIAALTSKLEEAMKDRTLEFQKLMIEEFKAETDRMKLVTGNKGLGVDPAQLEEFIVATVQNALASPDIMPLGGGAAPTAQPPAPDMGQPMPLPDGAAPQGY